VLLLCEIIVVFATAYPIGASEGILQTLCPANHTHDAARLSSLPLAVMIATAMSAIGTLVRVWCFRTLGRLFTFELSVRPDHVLATRGPYAYVRHPSYTACTLVMAAFVLTHFAPGSWESECAVLTHAGWGVPIVAYLFVAAWATLGLWRRGPVEDAKMREHFGAKWVEYRQRVRWGYIPFVY
jgi:protein-S-isoprenylcysteine O-methyltransferase Ste14